MSVGPPRQSPSRSLDELIRSAVETLRRSDRKDAHDTVLFLGARHQSFPALIVQDPILEPVDKIVWMVVWQRGAAGGAQAAFPSYAEIAACAHVRSDTTISRALAMLRATRWLSLCASVRGPQGRFRGNVYALHDEPLSLAATLTLDPKYLQFVKEATSHPHPRVCKVAGGVLAALEEDIRAGVDVSAPVNAIARRLEALRCVSSQGATRYFSFTPSVLRDLTNAATPDPSYDRLQDLETVTPLQDLEWGDRSSSSSNNKTTTTENSENAGEASATSLGVASIYPKALTDNQRALADLYLKDVPASVHQSLLDELEGRIRAARQGAKPLYDPIRYLRRLCLEMAGGRFVVNLGSQVAAERERRRAKASGTTAYVTQAPTSLGPQTGKNPGKSPVTLIREQFNLVTRNKPEV